MEIMILKKEGQEFEIPISKLHKAAFEKRHGRESLQRLYALLARDCNTFTEIGGVFGLTRERIRQIYEKRLAPYLPKKNGRERQGSCMLSRIHFYGKYKKRGFPEYVLHVWRRARKLGFFVSHINHVYVFGETRQISTSFKELLINGRLCKIYHAYTCQQSNARGGFYAHLCLGGVTEMGSCAFFVVAVAIKNVKKTYFIIPVPCDQLDNVAIYKDKKGYVKRFINLPLGSKHLESNPWRKYENAWHLLA